MKENAFAVGISPDFKIKYTSFKIIFYIKGVQIKKRGLDVGNVQALAKILIVMISLVQNSRGGDSNIYDIAQVIIKTPGNLTNWISYAMNHQITFITS